MKDTFVMRARRRATQWKSATTTIPEAARGGAAYLRDGKSRGMYPFCLPAGYATYNLLPDARESALREFADKHIAWHAQTALGPTNHLLSSQIQCVNALEPLAHDATPVAKAFGDVLPIAEPLDGGANRDPGMFDEPHRFDVTRANARDHLAFAAGIHYCLGASLARIEGHVALQTLFSRHPDLSVVAAPVRRRTKLLRGYDSIPVRLRASRHAAA